MIRLFQTFIVYSMLGWVLESVFHTVWEKKLVNRGFLNGPFVPIYGFGALLVVALLQPFREHWYVVFPVSIVLTTILEYITGWAMEKIFKNRWWDYSSMRFNLHGRICAHFSLGWGLLCLILVYWIDPMVRRLIDLPPQWLGNLIAAIVFAGIVFDLSVTVRATIDLNQKLRQLQSIGVSVRQRRSELADNVEKRMALLAKGFLVWRRKAGQLDYIQRRLLRAFPTFKSLDYPEAVTHLRTWLSRRRRRLIFVTRRIPNLHEILEKIQMPSRPALKNPFGNPFSGSFGQRFNGSFSNPFSSASNTDAQRPSGSDRDSDPDQTAMDDMKVNSTTDSADDKPSDSNPDT